MKMIVCLMLTGLAATAGSALAQSVAQPASQAKSRSNTQVAPVSKPASRSQDKASSASSSTRKPAPLATSPSQRAQAAPIGSGQASQNSARSAAEPAVVPEAAKVYDRNGQAVSGFQQAGSNRVLDTRTGRYYSTTPMGDGQRIER